MHGWDVSGIGPERIAGQANHLDSDISDRETIAEWLDEVRPTHLIHLAALSHVVGEPIEFYKTNLLGKPKFEKKPFEKRESGAYEDRKPFVDPDKPKRDKPYKAKGDFKKPEFKKPAFEGAARPQPGTIDYEAALKKMIETGEPTPRVERPEWKKQKRK